MPKPILSLHSDPLHTRLRKLREARGLRQRDLAKLLGRSQAIVSNVERGERRLDVFELHQWLRALGEDFLDFVRQLDGQLQQDGAGRPKRGAGLPSPHPKTKGRKLSPQRQNVHRVITAVGELMQGMKSKTKAVAVDA